MIGVARPFTQHRRARTRKSLKKAGSFIAQAALLWGVSIICNAAMHQLRLPVPGNAVTMLVTFVLLQAGVVRLPFVEAAASFFVRHLSVLFAPFAVGIVSAWGVLAPHAGATAAILVASVACGIGVAGLTAQALGRRSR